MGNKRVPRYGIRSTQVSNAFLLRLMHAAELNE
jgi:hypothetical protein